MIRTGISILEDLRTAAIVALLLAPTLAAEPRVTMYRVPGKQMPTEIVRHGDELWFVSWDTKPRVRAYLGRVTMRGRIRTHRVAKGHMPGLTTNAPDGTLWLSDAAKPVFWRVSANGKIDTVPGRYYTIGIAFGPDGRLWCTHQSALITRFGTDGSSQGSWAIPFDPPMASSLPPQPGPTATWIVAGPDGAMWFVEPYGRQIGRITMSGEMTLFRVPALGQFSNLVAGPDGALWFGTGQPLVGRITTAGEVTTFKVGMDASTVAADADGRIWFTGWGNTAGYIDKDRTIHQFGVPGAIQIRALAGGPDGAMWFADEGKLAIGRIELSPPAPRRP